VSRLCEFYPGICLTTEEKTWKTLSRGKKNLRQVKKNLSHGSDLVFTVKIRYKNFLVGLPEMLLVGLDQ
jgi:hypothetical protein